MKYVIQLFILLLIAFNTVTVHAETGRAVNYTVNEAPYEGYFVSAGDNSKLVLLIHDWDGLTDYEKKRAHMLADLGYSVFAADLFGAGVRPTEVKDRRQHTGELYEDREKMRALMNGALEAAQAQGADTNNAVVMGYCFGGAAVLELARSGADLKGFATFSWRIKNTRGPGLFQDKRGSDCVSRLSRYRDSHGRVCGLEQRIRRSPG